MVLPLGPARHFVSQTAMPLRPRAKFVLFSAVVVFVIYILWPKSLPPTELFPESLSDEASFGERGLLAQKLYQQVRDAESSWGALFSTANKKKQAENLATDLFPFIRHPSHPQDSTPLRSLRSTFSKNSRGIVIPAGKKNIIFARHAILALRDVLNVALPIAIAFAGDDDLPPEDQKSLLDLRPDVEMLDIIAVLSDETMNLRHGSWAVKPFAALASRFEQVILVDADTVFLQSPEIFFGHPGYKATGALFFHERRYGTKPGNDRQEFLKAQTKGMQLLDTCCEKIIGGDYEDEQDSGVVLLDKRDLHVLIGLLHTCWQNSSPVRDDITYKVFYGDKETYWIGMALTRAPYAFEHNWAGIVGELRERDGKNQICGNTISHSSEKEGDLIWYNGSLLRDKSRNHKTYMVPEYQMLGGRCDWVSDPELHFCCRDGEIVKLTSSERDILERSVEVAKSLDG